MSDMVWFYVVMAGLLLMASGCVTKIVHEWVKSNRRETALHKMKFGPREYTDEQAAVIDEAVRERGLLPQPYNPEDTGGWRAHSLRLAARIRDLEAALFEIAQGETPNGYVNEETVQFATDLLARPTMSRPCNICGRTDGQHDPAPDRR